VRHLYIRSTDTNRETTVGRTMTYPDYRDFDAVGGWSDRRVRAS
jgi:hypothetical protein